jgi:hypothetical protein
MAEFYGFDDYPTAIQTHEGSVVANVLLRQLRDALGYGNFAMPLSPMQVWEHTLERIRSAGDLG